jgi:hypothetical protein
MVYLRTLRNIGYYLYRTFSGAQSRVPLGQPNVRMAQIKEELHDQTGDVFREGPLMGCAYILQFICYAIVAIPLIIATFCLLIWVLLAA